MANPSLSAALAEIKANAGRFYVYVLSRSDGTPFYIGISRAKKGGVQRISQHFHEARAGENMYRHNTIRKIQSSGKSVGCLIDSWHIDRAGAASREVELIEKFGRHDLGGGCLVNKTAGGEGSRDLSLSSKARIAESASAKNKIWFADPANRAMFAEKLRQYYLDHPEACKRISLQQTDISSTAERVRAFSERMSRWITDNPSAVVERRAKATAALQSQEARRAASLRSIQQFSDPRQRKAQSERVKKRFADQEEKVAQAARLQVAFSQPAYRQKRSELARRQMACPDMRKRLAAAANKQWSDPNARQQAAIRAARSAKARREAAQRCRCLVGKWGFDFQLPSLRTALSVWLDAEQEILKRISTA